MKWQDKIENDNFQEDSVNDSWRDTDHKVTPSDVDIELFGIISDCFNGQFEIADVKTDPAYAETDKMVKQVISDYQKNKTVYKANEKFIRDSLSGKTSGMNIENEISLIKKDINNSNLNDISAGWVKEWNEKKHRDRGKDNKTEVIRQFITDSLKPSGIITEINKDPDKKERLVRRWVIRYTMLAAAAITGVVFLVRLLLPSFSPDKIFSKYYAPLSAVSSVTRNLSVIEDESFASAVESYKSGNYQKAAAGFSESMLREKASLSPRFFLGITQLALQNYDRAINLLDEVVSQQCEFTKEARWYLGLAYIKAGNKAKAAESFMFLAQSPGYYRERSEKILRRLK